MLDQRVSEAARVLLWYLKGYNKETYDPGSLLGTQLYFVLVVLRNHLYKPHTNEKLSYWNQLVKLRQRVSITQLQQSDGSLCIHVCQSRLCVDKYKPFEERCVRFCG